MTIKTRPRQFCCRCLASVTEYTTVAYADGRRFHFCANHQGDAKVSAEAAMAEAAWIKANRD